MTTYGRMIYRCLRALHIMGAGTFWVQGVLGSCASERVKRLGTCWKAMKR